MAKTIAWINSPCLPNMIWGEGTLKALSSNKGQIKKNVKAVP